jgi:hypothetical protein
LRGVGGVFPAHPKAKEKNLLKSVGWDLGLRIASDVRTFGDLGLWIASDVRTVWDLGLWTYPKKTSSFFYWGRFFLQRVLGIWAKNARRGILSNYPKKGAFLSDFVRFRDKELRFFCFGLFSYHLLTFLLKGALQKCFKICFSALK